MNAYCRDTAHCNGTDCLLAVSCLRYHLAVEAGEREEEKKDPYALIPWVKESYADGKCTNYLNRGK